MASKFTASLDDISSAIRRRDLALLFGKQDIAQRYRRSKVGAFWLTLNMGVLIASIGFVFGNIFGVPMSEFLPYLAAGLIFWGFISTCINDGCTAFIEASGTILQVRIPLFTHILRIWWRNSIILAHNLIILPIVLLVFQKSPGWVFPVALLGFAVVSINILWMSLCLAVLCARYRDMPQVVQNTLQVFFYATPLLWTPGAIAGRGISHYLEFNPFYHLISIVRSPLLGDMPSLTNWLVAIAMAICGWLFAIFFFGRYRWRVAYWL